MRRSEADHGGDPHKLTQQCASLTCNTACVRIAGREAMPVSAVATVGMCASRTGTFVVYVMFSNSTCGAGSGRGTATHAAQRLRQGRTTTHRNTQRKQPRHGHAHRPTCTIGVGGIMDPATAGEKLDAGATLVQVYTGLVYRGPFFAAEIARALGDRQLV